MTHRVKKGVFVYAIITFTRLVFDEGLTVEGQGAQYFTNVLLLLPCPKGAASTISSARSRPVMYET